jgi:hypothetical protein
MIKIPQFGRQNGLKCVATRIVSYPQGAYAVAEAQGLKLDVNGLPYPRHVDIIGWSPDKDARLMIATEIADKLALAIDPRRLKVAKQGQ